MSIAYLSATEATALLQRQAALQREAMAVITELDLMNVLARAGHPVQVGSSVLGLMVWRDIDFNVLCDPLSAHAAFDVVRPLISYPGVAKLRYSNETGRFNRTGQSEHEGYYWGVRFYTSQSAEWKIDIWFLPQAAPRPEITLLQTLPARLTEETRLAILWIKDVWHRLPTYRHSVLSVDIYTAVLEHGVRTPDEFDAYLLQVGKR